MGVGSRASDPCSNRLHVESDTPRRLAKASCVQGLRLRKTRRAAPDHSWMLLAGLFEA